MALNFDAASSTRRIDHGSGSSLDLLGNGASGFSTWMWVLRTSAADNQHLITKDASSPRGWLLALVNTEGESQLTCVQVRGVTNTVIRSDPGAVPIGRPTFVAAGYLGDTSDGNEVQLYTSDGVSRLRRLTAGFAQDGTGLSNDESSANLYVGNLQRANTNPFRGLIGPYGVVNRRLSLAELDYIRHATMRRATRMAARVPGTVLLGFPENAGAVQRDWSGNGNDGTVTGATDAADFVPRPTNERRQRRLFVVTGGGGAVDPATLELSIALGAPTIANVAAQSISPATLDLLLALGAPTIANVAAQGISPSGLALALGLNAPSISAAGTQSVSPDTLSLLLALGAATVSGAAPQTVAPGTLEQVLGLGAPTVAGAAAQTLSPETLALALGLNAPALVQPTLQQILPPTMELYIYFGGTQLSDGSVQDLGLFIKLFQAVTRAVTCRINQPH